MVTERVELTITAGSELDFEKQFAITGTVIRDAAGCNGIVLSRGVESPSRYLLLIEWRAVEDHQAFTRTDGFVQFGKMLGPYFAGKPSMEHFSQAVTF
jgi:heme-degrading monooxygenase HmoA